MSAVVTTTRTDDPAKAAPLRDLDDAHDVDVRDYWPKLAEPDVPLHLPPDVHSKFVQGQKAIDGKMWDAAAGVLRSALDVASKKLATEAGLPTLGMAKRMQALAAASKITDPMNEWAKHVTIIGDESLHDKTITEADAVAARDFAEMFLRYVYEMPEEVRIRSGQPAPAPQATP